MNHSWTNIVWTISIIGLVVACISFGEYIVRFLNWIFKSKNPEKRICNKIFEWFYYIDKNLDSINLEELELIEKEIDFLFRMDNNSKLMLKFNKRFIKKYLTYCGLKPEYCTHEIFIKYAHITHPNLGVILGLDSKIHKKKFNQFYMPLNTFWLIVRGNFHGFNGQYKKNWEGVKDEDKVIFPDIEMPITLLKMYYKLY